MRKNQSGQSARFRALCNPSIGTGGKRRAQPRLSGGWLTAIALATASSVLCLSGPALAQQAGAASSAGAGAAETGALPTTTVTAKGYQSEAAETPIATTVIDRDAIDLKGAHNLGDAVRGEAGLAVASDGAEGQNPVIRGLKTDSIVLMVDGVRLNSAQPAGAIGSFLTLGLAERVEVVKGPASVLYGTGALGGAINVQLPQARFDPGWSLRTHLSYDSASQGWRSAGVANFSSGDHALMLGASLARLDDYKTPSGHAPLTGYDSNAFIGQYRYRIDGEQQLRVSLQRHQDEDVWYPGSTRPHPLPAVGSLTIHSPTQTRTLYEVGYNRQGSGPQPVNLDVRLYRQEMQREMNGWANGLGRDISVTDVAFATDGLDAKAEWLVHPQHLLSLGLNAWKMKANPDSFAASPPAFATMQPNRPFDDGSLSAFGLYVQDDMQFGALKVLAGLRHDTVKGSAAAMNNGTVTSGIDRSDGATSGSLGVLYEATPLLRPYANVARGFRAADLRERYQNGPRQDGFYWAGSPQINPETATQFELGLKGESRTLNYTVALWRNRIDNYITGSQLTGPAAIAACSAPNAAACKQTVNLGRATLNGLEASVRWQAHPGHWIGAAYSHVRGTNDDLNEPLFQMPADFIRLSWEGRITQQWSLEARALLVRSQDRVATTFSRGTESTTPGYGVVDLGASWRMNPRNTLRLLIKNVGNKRYHEHLAQGLAGYDVIAPGRSFLVSWQGQF